MASNQTLDFDINQCIICQEEYTDDNGQIIQPVKATVVQKRMIEASNIRRDIVYKRLKVAEKNEQPIYYHMTNKCYKNYTNRSSLKFNKTASQSQENTSNDESRVTRHSVSPRPLPIGAKTPSEYHSKCIYCNQSSKNKVFKKFRICAEGRAQEFLNQTRHLKDTVYTRTCDLTDPEKVYAADLLYHVSCYKRYDAKYKSSIGKQTSPKPKTHEEAFKSVLDDITPYLNSGKAYSISDVCAKMCTIMVDVQEVEQRLVKRHLRKQFGNDVYFCKPKNRSKSEVFFLPHKINPIQLHTDEIEDEDPVIKCSQQLRNKFQDIDFGLEDKFMDSKDLEEAWLNISIPEPCLTFLATLFNVSKNDLNGENEPSSKARRVLSVYQIIHYIINGGNVKSPLVVLNAEMIHQTCKSKTLISGFNHQGICMSYCELDKYHLNMAKYALATNTDDGLPLPTTFDPHGFTIAALDNFDHEESTLSGKKGTHDTVTVLFQDSSREEFFKPCISEVKIDEVDPKRFGQLPCQALADYVKPTSKPILHESYKVPEAKYEMDPKELKHIEDTNIVWSLSRLNIGNKDNTPSGEVPNAIIGEQSMPSWASFCSITSKDGIILKVVGFPPILPFPVTDYSTVFTAMTNLKNLLNKLQSQEFLPTFCDEGVYCLAKTLQLHHPQIFRSLVLCIGTFHMTKILCGNIGKYLRGSGADVILTEAGVFGTKVVDLSVMKGKHYTRSVTGFFLLSEAIERLQWTEFFRIAGQERYGKEIAFVELLKEKVKVKDREGSIKTLKDVEENGQNLFRDFSQFKLESSQASETFRYWNEFVRMTYTLKNMIRADRTGDWALHLQAVQESLPLFAAFDSTNYIKWAAIYLEDMRRLPDVAPEVHEYFLSGGFVVKRTEGSFNAVAPDMALEQTINRSAKSTSGIIGSTKQKDYVTEWQLIHHEMLLVSSVFKDLLGLSKSHGSDLYLHHEFTDSQTSTMNTHVNNIITYIVENDNPFFVESMKAEPRLHNILTQEIMPDNVRESLLNIKKTGDQAYATIRRERFIEKKTNITDPVHRLNVKTFASTEEVQSKQRRKKDTKKKNSSQRTMAIAKERNYDIRKLLQYDLMHQNALFDENNQMKQATKSQLIRELESKHLTVDDMVEPTKWDQAQTVCIVDVMAQIRRLSATPAVKMSKTIGDFCQAIINNTIKTCKAMKAKRVDYVFDSYIRGSIKDSERIRRCTKKPIEFRTMTHTTPMPNNMDSFWASIENKEKFQYLLRKTVEETAKLHEDIIFVLSGTVGEQPARCESFNLDARLHVPDIDCDAEEADLRILPHCSDAALGGYSRIIVLSNDTDVMVMLLYYGAYLSNIGSKEIWARAGVGNSTRYLPIHILAERLGQGICNILPAIHYLTGSDVTSKMGTKSAALKVQPEFMFNLGEFGRNETKATFENAEVYLVKVLKPNSKATSMDELRVWLYHHTKSATIESLPPTSHLLSDHLKRAFLATQQMLTILNKDAIKLDPLSFGFHKSSTSDALMPTQDMRIWPGDLVPECSCIACSQASCICRASGEFCTSFCKCSSLEPSKCKNPFVKDSDLLNAILTDDPE